MAISNDVRKCVVFFAKPVPPKPGEPDKRAENVAYGGTGFLASYHSGGYMFRYLVTCRHVAEELDVDFFMSLNTNEGPSELAPIEVADWQYHPDPTVDIALTRIGLNARYYDHLALELSRSANKGNIACGQRIHIVGLFRLHRGSNRNVPIVHTGHIAVLADPKEKIAVEDRHGKRIESECYLVESTDIGGLERIARPHPAISALAGNSKPSRRWRARSISKCFWRSDVAGRISGCVGRPPWFRARRRS